MSPGGVYFVGFCIFLVCSNLFLLFPFAPESALAFDSLRTGFPSWSSSVGSRFAGDIRKPKHAAFTQTESQIAEAIYGTRDRLETARGGGGWTLCPGCPSIQETVDNTDDQGETTFGSHPCLRYPPPFSFWCCCRRGGGRATLCAPTFPLATRNHLATAPLPVLPLSLLHPAGLVFPARALVRGGRGPPATNLPPHPIGAFGDLLPLQVQAMDSAETNSGFLSQFFYPQRCYPNAPLPSCTLGTEHPYISTGTWQSSTQRVSCTISA